MCLNLPWYFNHCVQLSAEYNNTGYLCLPVNEGQKLQAATTEKEMRDVAARICKNYLHGPWKTVDPEDLVFRKMSGGLSNYLYYVALPDDVTKWCIDGPCDPTKASEQACCSPDDDKASTFCYDEPKTVLLRIYGQVHGERAMDTIVTESVIFTLLSERKLGPKLYGVFSGGRIEEYIPARCLLQKEMGDPSISMKLAEKMAAIHSMNVPLSKEPTWMWKTMARWLKDINTDKSFPKNKPKTPLEQQIMKQFKSVDFEKEIEWLKKYLATVDSPVVFCHNDLQVGNILLLESVPIESTTDDFEGYTVARRISAAETSSLLDKTNKTYSFIDKETIEPFPSSGSVKDKAENACRTSIQSNDEENTRDSLNSRLSDADGPQLVLIDFEFCAYNYRGFDIANHFNEWMYNYRHPVYPFYIEDLESAPTLEQKEIFIKEYLKYYQINQSEQETTTWMPSIDSVNKLLTEVEAFTLASHLFWAIWSVVQAGNSQIEFGYWCYGVSRLDMYFLLKNEVIKRDSSSSAQKRKICEVDI